MKLVSHQRITLLKNTQASAASVFFMGVFFSPDQAEFFSSQFFLLFLSHQTGSVLNFTDRASNLNLFGQSVFGLNNSPLRTDRRASGNKGLAIAGVPSFADTFVQGGSLFLRMKFSAKTHRHRKPLKRYWKPSDNSVNIK